jgi:hypothetical protein
MRDLGEKVVVSDFSLAHWIAQNYNLDINDWPKNKPDNFPKEIYEELKKILKLYIYHSKPVD